MNYNVANTSSHQYSNSGPTVKQWYTQGIVPYYTVGTKKDLDYRIMTLKR